MQTAEEATGEALSRRVSCVVCGRQVFISHAKRTATFDPETQAWACSGCVSPRGRVDVICPTCPPGRHVRSITRSLLGRLITRDERDGQIYASCRPCARRKNAAAGRQARAEDLISQRIHWLRAHPPETTGDALLAGWLLANPIRNAPATYLALHQAEPAISEIVGVLVMEALLRKTGNGDVARGIVLRRERAPVAGRRAPTGPSPSKSRAHVARGELGGVCSRCPLCGLFVYRKTASHERFGQGWHPPCLRAWRALPAYREWSGRRLAAVNRGVDTRLVPPFPQPPVLPGRPITSRALADAYRALVRNRVSGTSLPQIAAQEGVTRQAVQMRIASILNLLPATWELVFGDAGKGNTVRQQYCPLPQVGDGQRNAAERMAKLGVSADVILQVTGTASTADA